MSAETDRVLAELARPARIHVHSTGQLVQDTDRAAAGMDRERARRAKSKEEVFRKPQVEPLQEPDGRDLEITAWQALGTLARATTLARHGLGRGLAEHWQSLKYCRALAAPEDRGPLSVTSEGQSPERSYRGMQARELGRAFGLAVAERTVRHRHPDRIVAVIDAEAVLLAGFARSDRQPTLGNRPRPDYFIEAWRPEEPSVIYAVTVNGNHQVATSKTGKAQRTSFRQLAKASERAEHLHLGSWNTTPCLMMATELLAPGGITVHALQAPGSARLRSEHLDVPDDVDIDRRLKRNLKYVDTVQVPCTDGDPREHFHDAFFVPVKELAWFGQVLASTDAASQLAWAGAGREIARYLTSPQGRRHYQERTFAGAASVRDAHHTFGDDEFVGTDQVFRLAGQRVEAFSGIAKDLYELLEHGKVEEYRRHAYDHSGSWPTATSTPGWGPASFRDDGTVMALRILPKGDENTEREQR
ncbi:hypothetical protein DN069_27605 [Streptacidiphilus pinicola]|uniref:Uncharacterized protein n=1 Tax=Streptacidiphilus pinicola TaxID=2219663 RepID=A0A2X0IXA6_9ACTN|nr:hypothetical protein [Streptacidiphilus pinicola]RAG82436.1 hypothetical protein DN069_27605 [Streptacidiphilus pinicola]